MTEAVDIRTGGNVLPPVSAAVVAKGLVMSERQVYNLTKQGVLSQVKRGKWDLLQCVREYIAWLRDQNGEIESDPDKMPPKERLDWYRGETERVKLATNKGELVPSMEYEQALATALKRVATSLESLPDVLERDAGIGGEAVERCIAVVDDVREEIYKSISA